jgi:hypothetical protein
VAGVQEIGVLLGSFYAGAAVGDVQDHRVRDVVASSPSSTRRGVV